MRHRYPLAKRLQDQATTFEELANGGAQCHARLLDGTAYGGLLVSNSTAIIAMRGYITLPFKLDSIDCLFQGDEDRNPTERGGWQFFDEW